MVDGLDDGTRTLDRGGVEVASGHFDKFSHTEIDTDVALLCMARAGDDGAFRDLYRQYVGDARREARRCCGTDAQAEDAVAAAFSSVFRAVAAGVGPENHLRPYLLKAVRNAVIDQSRRAKARPVLEPIDSLDIPAAEVSVPVVLGARMRAALGVLPGRQQRALWATEVEGRSAVEMADELQLTTNAFAALKKRARQNLAVAYAAEVAGGDTCGWVAQRIDRFVNNELNKADELLVRLHTENCETCTALLPDRRRVELVSLMLPLLLAVPATYRARPARASEVLLRRLLHSPVAVVAVATTAFIAGSAAVLLSGSSRAETPSGLERSSVSIYVDNSVGGAGPKEETPSFRPADHPQPSSHTDPVESLVESSTTGVLAEDVVEQLSPNPTAAAVMPTSGAPSVSVIPTVAESTPATSLPEMNQVIAPTTVPSTIDVIQAPVTTVPLFVLLATTTTTTTTTQLSIRI